MAIGVYPQVARNVFTLRQNIKEQYIEMKKLIHQLESGIMICNFCDKKIEIIGKRYLVDGDYMIFDDVWIENKTPCVVCNECLEGGK